MTERRSAVDEAGAPLPATAIVLAGGLSTRMGTPKALLQFEGETLLARLVRLLAAHFAEVVVVAAPGQAATLAQRAGLPHSVRLVEDEVPGAGPVGGLHAGLRAAKAETAFVTGCDAPFLQPALARLLARRAVGHAGAVAEWGGRIQPLPAAFGKALLAEIDAQLRTGSGKGASGARGPRLGALARRGDLVVVGEEQIREVDPEGLSFVNVNTPEEYARALAAADAPAG